MLQQTTAKSVQITIVYAARLAFFFFVAPIVVGQLAAVRAEGRAKVSPFCVAALRVAHHIVAHIINTETSSRHVRSAIQYNTIENT